MSTNHLYGWKPDFPDKRDRIFQLALPEAGLLALPPKVDLRPKMPPVWSQQLGDCTAHATAGQCWFMDKTSPFEPSRQFIYYNTRVLEGTVKYDSGASIRNSVKSVAVYGFPPETVCKYDPKNFKKKPSADAYSKAKRELVTKYSRVLQTPTAIKGCLAEGFPVNFGFSVYESFESDVVAKTGVMPMPRQNESLLGGHAVLFVGYDDEHAHYIPRNSWGLGWGDKGYFYMPYAFAHDADYCADFWTIRAVP